MSPKRDLSGFAERGHLLKVEGTAGFGVGLVADIEFLRGHAGRVTSIATGVKRTLLSAAFALLAAKQANLRF